MAEYRLKPKALEDMESIWLYSQQVWGNQQANQYIENINNACIMLVENPKAGFQSDHIRAGYRKYEVFQHVIYYKESDFGVGIVRILHNRMLADERI